MDINKAQPIHPNLIIIDTPIKNYSPIELVQYYMSHLDKNIGTYVIFNVTLRMGHKVIIDDKHIEAKEFII